MSAGILEAEIVAVWWAGRTRAYYVEAYENEPLFWSAVTEAQTAPERAYKLKGDKLAEWDFADAYAELRADAAIDQSHRDARRVA